MKKTILAIVVGAMMAFCLAACGSPAASSSSASASADSASASASAASAEASPAAAATPTEAELAELIVDEQAKTITVWGQVNGKYFTEDTHHFLVNKDGKNGEKAVFRAWAKPADFHAALMKLGAKPGDNLKVDEAAGKFIEGDKINVTVSWDGSNGEIPMSDCIKTKDGSPYKTDIRFGGNLDASNEYQTGCLCCTFSCPVGICSNAAYAYDSGDVNSNGDVLPADGTYVRVKFTLA